MNQKRWLPWIAAILYFILGGAVYWGAKDNQAIPEDERVVWENPAVTGDAPADVLLGRFYHDRDEYHDAVRPVSTAVNRIRFDAFGAQRPGFLWFQVLLHAVAAALLFALVRSTTGGTVVGLLVGLVFAVHPAVSSSLLRLAGVSEVLALVFGLGALLAVGWSLRVSEEGLPKVRIGLALALFLFAVGSKEAAFLFAPVLILYAWAARPDSNRGAQANLVLVLGVLGVCAIALVHRMVSFALLPSEAEIASAVHPDSGLPFVDRAWLGFQTVWEHLRLLVFPRPLAVTYDFLGLAEPGAAATVRGVGGVLVVGSGMVAAVVACVRRRATAALWISLATAALVAGLGVVAPVGDFLNERSMYFIVPAWLGLAAWAYAALRSSRGPAWLDPAGLVLVVLLAGTLGILTAKRTQDFKNQEILIRAQIRDYPASAYARFELGNFYLSRGQYASARDQYELALERNPELWMAWINLGAAYSREQDFSLAMRAYDRALQGASDLPEYRVPMAKARFNRAIILMRQNRNNEAALDLEKTLEVLPDHLRAHANLGFIYRNSDKYDEQAIFHLKRAIELETDPALVSQLEEAIEYIHQRREVIEQRRQLRINAGQLPEDGSDEDGDPAAEPDPPESR